MFLRHFSLNQISFYYDYSHDATNKTNFSGWREIFIPSFRRKQFIFRQKKPGKGTKREKIGHSVNFHQGASDSSIIKLDSTRLVFLCYMKGEENHPINFISCTITSEVSTFECLNLTHISIPEFKREETGATCVNKVFLLMGNLCYLLLHIVIKGRESLRGRKYGLTPTSVMRRRSSCILCRALTTSAIFMRDVRNDFLKLWWCRWCRRSSNNVKQFLIRGKRRQLPLIAWLQHIYEQQKYFWLD